HAGYSDDLGRAGGEPFDALDGVVHRSHRELVALAEPAPDRLAQPVLQLAAYVEDRGGAWPGVDVLVGAADREVGTARVELDRHRADRVAQVPQHEGAGLVH